MPGEDRFVIRNIFVAARAHAGFQFQDAVDEQQRIAVRKDLHDPADVEFGHYELAFAESWPPIWLRRCPVMMQCSLWPLLIATISPCGQAPSSAKSPSRSSTL